MKNQLNHAAADLQQFAATQQAAASDVFAQCVSDPFGTLSQCVSDPFGTFAKAIDPPCSVFAKCIDVPGQAAV